MKEAKGISSRISISWEQGAACLCILPYVPPVLSVMTHVGNTRQLLLGFVLAHNVALGAVTVVLNVFSEVPWSINTHMLPKLP